jgi:alkylhydroperoxidase family enzyme
MARIPYPDPRKLSPAQLRSWNGPLNVGKMCAYLPDDVLTSFNALGRSVLTNTTLDQILREMAIVRVGYISNSPYEVHHHVKYSQKIGMDPAKLEALKLGSEAPVFSGKERAVLAFVEELVLNVRPGEATLNRLLECLTVAEVFTLIVSVGMYMTVCRLLETAGVDTDQDSVTIEPQAMSAFYAVGGNRP